MLNKEFKNAVEVLKSAGPVANADIDKMVNMFSDGVNDLCFKTVEAAEYIYSKGTDFSIPFHAIAIAWVNKLVFEKEHNFYDARNEAAVETAKKLSGCDTFKNERVSYNDDVVNFANFFAEKMSGKHRTLQESFSGVVFKYLQIEFRIVDSFGSELAAAGLDEDYWWEMPMI